MADWNRETPWRQGHILTDSAVSELGLCHKYYPDCTFVVVATHDCDLAQLISGDPNVEVVVGRVINKLDGNFTHAKTSRKLHVVFSGTTSCLAELEASEKTNINKEKLAAFMPRTDIILTSENHSIFQFWLASRYRRSAFPDEFERRLKDDAGLAKKISKILECDGNLVAGIFFDVDDGVEITRIGEDDTYTLDIYILYLSEPDVKVAESAAKKIAEAIEKAFIDKLFAPTKTWKFIELRSCEPVSESVLTYQQFKQLKRWRLEHISLSSDPQQPVMAE